MKMRKILSCLLAVTLLLCGCTDPSVTPSSPDIPTNPTDPVTGETITLPQNAIDPSGLFSDRDLAGTFDTTGTVITFTGSTAEISGAGATLSGSTVIISQEGTYILRGTMENGMVLVSADSSAKVQLVLDTVSIHSATSAPIYVRNADKTFITLAPGSTNVLSNGGSFVAVDDNNVDAVIFSKDDLTINGSGSLTITSPAGHGIVSKNELTVTGGSYDITAASHGMTGEDSICITAASLQIQAGKDGLQAENDEDTEKGYVYIKDGSLTITCDGDGISATGFMQIDGGTFTVTAGGGYVNGQQHSSDDWGGGMGPGGRPGGRPRSGTSSDTSDTSTSAKGFKADGVLIVNGGEFTLDTADDTFHSGGDLTVTGGTITLSSGDDGFHSDAMLHIAGGTVTIHHSYEGLEGLSIVVSGGNITITASDDGMNAAGGNDQSGFGPGGRPGGFEASSDSFITISGGTIYMQAGGDGIDSNGALTVTGGHITIHGPTQGDTSVLDYGSTGTISGGTFIGTGAMNMAVTFNKAENQGIISVSIGGNLPAGTEVKLTDADGNVVISTTPADSFAFVILSCPQMVKGQTYTLTVGELSKAFTAE